MPDESTLSEIEAPFVVLRHVDAHGVHFDLMIDLGAALATWKIAQPPETAGESGLACERIRDHRRAYLDYEGPVSGNRGEVTRHDAGTCRRQEKQNDAWRVVFHGQKLSGRFMLERRGPDQGWLLRCVRD